MPRFNSRGDWCAGIGGGSVTVNDTRIASNAGQACWLDDDRVIYQQGAHLETYNVRTGAYVRDFDPEGANELAAGGGVYAAKFNGVVRVKYLDGEMGRYPGFIVGDVALDGTVQMVTPDGAINGLVIRFVQALGAHAWSGLDSNYRPVQSAGVPFPHVIDGRTYGFRRAGEFCCYQTEDERIIVQYIDRAVGKVIGHARNAHRPDLVRRGDQLCVIYATDEGELVNVLLGPIPISALTEKLTAYEPPVIIDHGGEVLPTPTEPTGMLLPDRVQSIVNRLYAAHRNLADGTDDQRRELTQMIAEQTRYEMGEYWGWKRADAGRPPAKDAIAYQAPGAHLIAWDLFNGSTRAPNDHPQSEDIEGQVFMPVPAINHLGDVTGPPPASTPAPQPTIDLSDILRRLAALEAKHGQRVAIRTDDGHYLCAEQGGGGSVNATRSAVGGWETFTLEPQG